MTLSQRSRRRTGLAAGLVAAALATSACSFVSPRQTNVVYPPSDGSMSTIELADGTAVQLHNILVVSEAEGSPGRVVGAIEVSGSESAEVELSADFGEGAAGTPVTVTVPPNTLTILGPEDEDVVLDSVGAAPGAYIEMTASTPRGGSTEFRVPVFPPTYPYEGLAPEAATTEPAAAP